MPSKTSTRTSRGAPRGAHVIAATLALIGGSFYPPQSALAAPKQAFPKIGQYLIGGPQPYDVPSNQAQLARFDVAIIDFYANRWSGATMRAIVQAIKARNPNIILLDYAVVNEVSRTAPGVKYLRDKLDAHKWWLYPSGTSGSSVNSVWPGAGMTNYTNFPPIVNGDRYNTWYAKKQYELVWSQVSHPHPLNAQLDGTYEDNFFWRPRVVGDWDRVGGGDSQSKSIPWHRAGLLTHVNTIKQLLPGKYVTGNIGDWRNTSSVPEYKGQLDGGILEGYLCMFERSFSETLSEYHRRMGETKGPKLVMLGAFDCVDRGYDHFKSFRYALGIALMNDGYLAFNENYTKFPIDWFDEYQPAGKSTTGWLGTATQGPQTSPCKNGVYKREFQNGMALVNPGNEPRTFTVGSGWRRIKGQASVNTGTVTTSVTLPKRDGIVLMREGAGPVLCN